MKRRPWPGSLKGRLVLLFLLLALGTTGVFLFGMQRVLQGSWQSWARPLVADYVDRLAAEIGSPPDLQRARAMAARLPITVRIDGPQLHFDSAPGRHLPEHPAEGPWAQDEGVAASGLVRHTPDGHRIRFGLALPPEHRRPVILGWFTLAALLLLTALAYAAVRRQLAPLQAIGAGVQAYGRGEFGTPIPVPRSQELGLLASRVNGMAANLAGMLEAKRALLLAISHELRSPLTRARVNAELLDDSPEREALLRDLGEMRDLISSLLESERLAQGHAALQAEPVDLPALVRELTEGAFAGQPLALALQDPGAPVQADPTRLRLLLRNLVANALRHAAGAEPPPEIYLRREPDGRLALGVRDHGPGVPLEQLQRLGEAFYRPDRARARSSGGVGLGLHLCRLVAAAHGGELRLRDAGPGLDAAMVWPA